jgi:hypothetical protein
MARRSGFRYTGYTIHLNGAEPDREAESKKIIARMKGVVMASLSLKNICKVYPGGFEAAKDSQRPDRQDGIRSRGDP